MNHLTLFPSENEPLQQLGGMQQQTALNWEWGLHRFLFSEITPSFSSIFQRPKLIMGRVINTIEKEREGKKRSSKSVFC